MVNKKNKRVTMTYIIDPESEEVSGTQPEEET
jgi:hypothetical protein